jgi:MFS family permease
VLSDAVSISLAAAALLAGFAGTWSPCGFSMIETIGPAGHRGGAATTIAACATFTLGALAGGVATFGALAVIGDVAHSSGEIAYIIAAAIAICAAVAEVRGVRILPQVRRQLPEHWRRLMPMPLAAGLYGVLLGLGFTTFVLSFGVFALAGIVFAVGQPAVGFAVGLAFGIGRAVPIALTAPVADREAGIRITEAMAERPALYRAFRLGDGLALLAAAGALAVALPAGASKNVARPAADPSVAGKAVVYQLPDGSGVIRRGSSQQALPGHDPAIGAGTVAVIRQGRIVILSAASLGELGSFAAPGADAVAVSRQWVVWRSHGKGRDSLHARRIDFPREPGPVRSLGRSGRNGQLGRPSLDDNRLVYARAAPAENAIFKRVLGAKRKHAKSRLLRSRVDGLQNPSLRGRHLLYVRVTRKSQRLMLARAGGGKGRVVFRTGSATLWTTALSHKRAYVTVLHGSAPRARIVSVNR